MAEPQRVAAARFELRREARPARSDPVRRSGVGEADHLSELGTPRVTTPSEPTARPLQLVVRMAVLESDGAGIDDAGGRALVVAPTSVALEPVPVPERNPAVVYLARLSSPASRRTMKAALATIAKLASAGTAEMASFPWARLRYEHTITLRSALVARYAPATANKHLTALRAVLREAWRLGQIGADVYRRAVDLEPVRGEQIPAGRELRAAELRALFEVCAADLTPAGSRDAALLAVLHACGLRRAEAVALALGDYDRTSCGLRVRPGKGCWRPPGSAGVWPFPVLGSGPPGCYPIVVVGLWSAEA